MASQLTSMRAAGMRAGSSHLSLRRHAGACAAPQRARSVAVRAGNDGGAERKRYNTPKGKQFENARRRRGRPAWMRSPDDTPLRDGNRDRLIGLLTERAAKTLMIYLMETNANVYSWLLEFYKANPIPRNGSWDEVSGEAFLRKLLSMPIEEARYNTGRDSLFENVVPCGVDPRSIAQRVMDIRSQLSQEFIQELQAIAEENNLLLRETLQTSLTSSLNSIEEPTPDAPSHPERGSSSSAPAGAAGSGTSTKPKPAAASAAPPPQPATAAPPSSKQPEQPPSRARGGRTPEKKPSDALAQQRSSASARDASAAGDVDKAAAVAALNAALKASPSAGSAALGSHPELQAPPSGSSGAAEPAEAGADAAAAASDGKVAMEDVLAQLRRSLDADVALLSSAEAVGAAGDSTAVPAPAPEPAEPAPEPEAAAAPAAELEAEAAASAPSAELQPELEAGAGTLPAAAAAALELQPPAAAAEGQAASAAGGGGDAAPTAQLQQQTDEPQQGSAEDGAAPAAAALAAPCEPEAARPGADAARPSGGGEMPKGWGPRLGVGYSKLPRNNIVSSAALLSKAAAVQQAAAADAAAGSGSAA